MIVIKGIAASPGIAIGKAYVLEDEEIVVNRIELPRELLRAEIKRFKAAYKATHRDLDAAEAYLAQAEVKTSRSGPSIAIHPSACFGLGLELVEG